MIEVTKRQAGGRSGKEKRGGGGRGGKEGRRGRTAAE
jgi:hypothetical protein